MHIPLELEMDSLVRNESRVGLLHLDKSLHQQEIQIHTCQLYLQVISYIETSKLLGPLQQLDKGSNRQSLQSMRILHFYYIVTLEVSMVADFAIKTQASYVKYYHSRCYQNVSNSFISRLCFLVKSDTQNSTKRRYTLLN